MTVTYLYRPEAVFISGRNRNQEAYMEELISIIVPIYRVEKYLDQCIQSLVNQTYKHIEIILVDDGSDDSCPEICDYYARKDQRIIVIHKENGGADHARKAGILAATGKYVGYVDGDDWIEADMFERLLGFAKKYDVEIVESGVIDVWDETSKKRVPFFEEGCYKGEKFSDIIGPKSIYSGVFFRHGIYPYLFNKLFLKERILKYQMMPEPTNNIVDDVMCTFPCIMESRSVYVTHQCYYNYRVRNASAKRLIRKDIESVVKMYYPDWLCRFSGAIKTDRIREQLEAFVMYLLIAKAIHAFDNQNSEFYLVPFGPISKRAKLILYGAGTVGIHIHHYITNIAESNLIYWADYNYKQLRDGIDVNDPQNIVELEYDYVVLSILNKNAVDSAKNDLIRIGVPEEKILWIRTQ